MVRYLYVARPNSWCSLTAFDWSDSEPWCCGLVTIMPLCDHKRIWYDVAESCLFSFRTFLVVGLPYRSLQIFPRYRTLNERVKTITIILALWRTSFMVGPQMHGISTHTHTCVSMTLFCLFRVNENSIIYWTRFFPSIFDRPKLWRTNREPS